jgi:hypothetical protein
VLSRAFVHTHDFAGVSAAYARVRVGGAVRVTARCGGGNLGVPVHLTVRR